MAWHRELARLGCLVLPLVTVGACHKAAPKPEAWVPGADTSFMMRMADTSKHLMADTSREPPAHKSPPKHAKPHAKAPKHGATGDGGPSFPSFPWPPPHASAFQVLPRALVARRGAPTLGEVAGRLESALKRNGYTELSYYAVSQGFALATRLEEINEDGTSKQPPDRWAPEVPMRFEFSLSAIVRTLFTANPGRYRIIVFIATPHPLTQDTATATREEAMNWVVTGMDVLPPEIARRAYTRNHNTTALIYEFQQLTRDQAASLKDPSLLTGNTHLQKAGILAALGT